MSSNVKTPEYGNLSQGSLQPVWHSLLRNFSPYRKLLSFSIWQELQLELEAARLRLVRRSQIIDAIRKAYVRDVVMIKNELARKANMSDGVSRPFYPSGRMDLPTAIRLPMLAINVSGL